MLILAGNARAEMSQPRLVFAANVDGNWDLFSVDEDGKNLIRLTSTPYDEKEPSWSSDRQKIVYATSDGQLNVIDIVTKEQHQLNIGNKNNPPLTPL